MNLSLRYKSEGTWYWSHNWKIYYWNQTLAEWRIAYGDKVTFSLRTKDRRNFSDLSNEACVMWMEQFL